MASSRSIPLIPLSTSPLSTPPSTTPTTPATSSTPPAATSTNGATSVPSTPSPSTQTTAATSSTPSSSSLQTSLLPTGSQVVSTTGGTVDTVTSTSFVLSSATPTAQNNSTSSNSFFSNKGAVAGVFTVVGLIVFALVIALIVNAIRRRRAQKFDRDVAEAAAEAAASSRSPFDDYSYPNPRGNGGGGGDGGGYGYSDNSHGTYQSPPLPPPPPPPHGDLYGASEMSQYDPYAAGAASLAAAAVGRSRSRKDSEPGTPGIAGVGAGTLAREPSKRAPYHAFAGPGPQPPEFQGTNGTFGSRRSHQDVLEAAGLGGAPGVAAITSNNTSNGGAGNAYVARRSSNTTQNTHFNGGRSQIGSVSSGGHHPPTLQPGYTVDSYYPQRGDSLSPDPFAGYPIRTAPSQPLLNPYDATATVAAPLPSVTGHQSEHHEDYIDSSPTALRHDEQRMSYQDDTDYSQRSRVLRVANE